MAKELDLKASIFSCLESTFYCVLSTEGADGEGPWANPVYFAYDSEFNFYFMSLMHSRHMQNMARSPRIAIAVFSTDQPPGEHVVGVQLAGTATLVADVDVPSVCDIYFAREGAAIAIGVDVPNPSDYQGNEPEKWKFVKVVPSQLGLFSSAHFGEERMPVDLEIVR